MEDHANSYNADKLLTSELKLCRTVCQNRCVPHSVEHLTGVRTTVTVRQPLELQGAPFVVVNCLDVVTGAWVRAK